MYDFVCFGDQSTNAGMVIHLVLSHFGLNLVCKNVYYATHGAYRMGQMHVVACEYSASQNVTPWYVAIHGRDTQVFSFLLGSQSNPII